MNPNEDCILDLKALSARSCLSVRKLRNYLNPDHPQFLKHYRMRGKTLVRWLDFLEWLDYFRIEGNFQDKVNDIVTELRKQDIRHQSKE
jgi:hypothetical protein